jgi:glutathione S-transferase
MQLTLYDWPPSPFSLKVRAVLEYKGLAYDRVPIISPKHWRKVRAEGKVGKAPALLIDGKLFVDSTDICHELDRRAPEPSILPADPERRALCHAIEEWSDESLYFVGLYYQWLDPAGRAMVPAAFGRSLAGRLAYHFYLRRVLAQLKGQGTSRKTPEHVRSDLERHLDALCDLIGPDGGYLLDARPRLCDFAVFGQLAYLGRTPAGASALAGRTALNDYVKRMKSLKQDKSGA